MKKLIIIITTIFLSNATFASPQISKNSKVLFNISKDIKEVSGTVYDSKRNVIWSIGDSGDGDRSKIAITKMDTWETKVIKIKGAKNIDWEAIAIDRENDLIYILDVGDNKAVRDIKQIYKINPKDIVDNEITKFKIIQVRYTPEKLFDVEAAFIKNNHLYFVEKTIQTSARIYSIDLSLNLKGIIPALWYGTIGHSPIFITDAEVNSITGEIYLLSYLGISKLKHFDNSAEMTSTPLRIGYWGQIESLCIDSKDQFIIAREDGDFFYGKK